MSQPAPRTRVRMKTGMPAWRVKSCASACCVHVDRDANGRVRLTALRDIDLRLEESRNLVPGGEPVVASRNVAPGETSILSRPRIPGTGGHHNCCVHVRVDVTVHLHDPAVVEFHGAAFSLRIKPKVERLSLRKGEDIVKNRV